MRKPAFCICENKGADQGLCFPYMVFPTWIVQSLCFLNPKFQATSHFLWLYSLVCVRPGRKPKDRFSHDKAHFVCRFQGIVYIDKDVVGWRPIAKSWLESRTPQEIHVSTAE